MEVPNPNSFCHGVILCRPTYYAAIMFDTVPVTLLRWKNKMCLCGLTWIQCAFRKQYQVIHKYIFLHCTLAVIGLQPLMIRQHSKLKNLSKMQVFDLWKQTLISES